VRGSALTSVFDAIPFPRLAASPRLGHIVHRLVVALAAVALVTAFVLGVFRTRYDDRVLPSVVVADVEIGGMTRAEAQSAVATRVDGLLDAPVTFNYDGRTWTTSLRELGVSADTDGAVSEAFALGREDTARARVDTVYDVARGGATVQLAMRVDREAAKAWVARTTEEIGLKPRDATLRVEDGKVIVEPDVDGVIVDGERIDAVVDEAVRSFAPYTGPLPVLAKPATTHTEDLADEADRLEKALSKSITIAYKKKKWKLKPEDLGQFVILTPSADGRDVSVELDKDALADWLRPVVAEALNRDPVDATISWEGDRIIALSESSDGIRVRPDSLAREIDKSFFGDHEPVDIPIRVLKPAVDSDKLETLNITTKLGTGTSNFAGSEAERATNIWVGSEQLNGAVVPPGGVFSFNDAIGDITEDKGYVEAGVIEAERIGKDIGGGICQVSTTVFRAAYLAGMPMEEWHPHVYRLSFYEQDGWDPGLDAAIFQEGAREEWDDFKFLNPTDGWLLVEAYVSDTQVTVNIYGPDTGWKVESSEPEMNEEGLEKEKQPDLEIVDEELPSGTVQQTEWALDGLEVTHYRTVRDRDGNVIREDEFYTPFAPRGDVFKVSPDMVGMSPAAESDDGPTDDETDVEAADDDASSE
jgi:vancomycin resistance protein YoaR